MPRTLCEWDKRDIERDLDRLAGVIGTPRFVCRKCARSAEDPRFLCKPIKLPRQTSAPAPTNEPGLVAMSVTGLAIAPVP